MHYRCGNLINGIRHYFSSAQPNKDSLIVFQQMLKEGKSHTYIREDFGERLKQYYREQKNITERQDLVNQIYENENLGGIIPIPISAIKGLNIGECTEYALMSQNVLSFLGYNTFMIQGKTFNSKGQKEGHHFNCIEKNGRYMIFDSTLFVCALAPKIKTPEELLIFDEMHLHNTLRYGQENVTYFSDIRGNKYNTSESQIRLLASKGENFRVSAMSDLKEIQLSKRIIEKSKEGEEIHG